MGSTNYEHAKTIAKKIKPYLGVTYEPSIIRVQTPQQVNTVDCGIYMLIVTDAIVFGIFEDNKINMNITFEMLVRLMPTVKDSDVLNKRAVIALMIHKYQYISMNQGVLKSLMFNKCWEKEYDAIQAKYTDLLNQNLDKMECNKKLPIEFNTDKTLRHTIPQNAEENRTSYLTHDTKNNGWIYVTRGKSNKLKNRQLVTNQPIVTNKNRYQQLISRVQEVEDSRTISTSLYNHANIKHKKYIKKKSTYKKSSMPKYSGEKIKLSLFSDSQGRGISDFISKESEYVITGEGYVASNAHLGYVTKVAQSMKSGDAIVLIGGTNDLLNDDLSYIYKNWEHELAVLSETKPVIITTIPQRFDCQDNSDLVHLKLTRVNNYIRELAARIKNVYLVELEDLNRSQHTYHGLHLNMRGKREIVCQIIHKLNLIFNNNPQNILGKKSANEFIKRPTQYNNNKIEIIEADMAEVIETHKRHNTVAFAHCISSDFQSDRHMSAGVSKIFAKKFGKPLASDCIGIKLTCQQVKNGSTIYGLATKERYCDKPELKDYNIAFHSLSENFKARGLTQLICSPMGCVRDNIPIEHFANKIIEFQICTGALVTIVVNDEYSSRSLRNGLSFSTFITELKSVLKSATLGMNKISAMQYTTTSLAMTPGDTSSISIPTDGKDSSIPINSKEEDGNLNNPSISLVSEECPYAITLCNDLLQNNSFSDVNESVILPHNEKSIICDDNSEKCKGLNKSVNVEHEKLVERSQDIFLEVN